MATQTRTETKRWIPCICPISRGLQNKSSTNIPGGGEGRVVIKTSDKQLANLEKSREKFRERRYGEIAEQSWWPAKYNLPVN